MLFVRHLPRLYEPLTVVLCLDSRPQVDRKRDNVEREDEGDDPLNDSCCVAVVCPSERHESDSQEELDEDEEELDPEGDSEDAVIAVLDTQTLILRADKDRGNPIATNEQQQKHVMKRVVAVVVEIGQRDETDRSNKCKDNRHGKQNLLALALVWYQAAPMPQPPLRRKGDIESDDRHGTHGNEQRLHLERSNVGDIGDLRSGVYHRRERPSIEVDGPEEKHAEKHAEPCQR